MSRRVYIPGYLPWKLAGLFCGLITCALGLAQIYRPALAWWQDGLREATVVRVVKTKPGFPDTVYETTASIPPDGSHAVFQHFVEYQDKPAHRVTLLLNVSSQGKPAYQVGDSVQIACLRGQEDLAYAIDSLATWTLGGLVFLFGLLLSASMAMLSYYALTPIEIPPDTPTGYGV